MRPSAPNDDNGTGLRDCEPCTVRRGVRSVLHQREAGTTTISFIVTLFWTLVILLIFLQFSLIGYTWQVTGYAAYASARARIVGRLFNTDYKDVAENVMKGSLPKGWGSTWVVQELPLGIGVVVLYGQEVMGIPVPVVGRAVRHPLERADVAERAAVGAAHVRVEGPLERHVRHAVQRRLAGLLAVLGAHGRARIEQAFD